MADVFDKPRRPVEVIHIFEPYVSIQDFSDISQRMTAVRVGVPDTVGAGLVDLEVRGERREPMPISTLVRIAPENEAAIEKAEQLWIAAQDAVKAALNAFAAIPTLTADELRAMMEADHG